MSKAGEEENAEAEVALRAPRRRKTMRFLKALVYATCTIFCLVGLGKVGSVWGGVVLLIAALGLGIAAMGQFAQGVFDVSDKRKTQIENAQESTVDAEEPAWREPQEIPAVELSPAEQRTQVKVAPVTQVDADDLEHVAEAVLLALGKRITWSQPMPYADSSFWLGRDKENSEGDTYTVRYEKPPASVLAISPTYVSSTPWAAATIGGEEGGPRSVIIGGEKTVPQHKYRTVDDAKTACERHNTTGEWK